MKCHHPLQITGIKYQLQILRGDNYEISPSPANNKDKISAANFERGLLFIVTIPLQITKIKEQLQI